MRGPLVIAALVALACPGVALADTGEGNFRVGPPAELPAYLQCVPYARERTGVQIYGDARTWWDQAAGRYRRGTQPRPGAVMAFRPTGSMVLGHVAAVARVIDRRTVLLDHANWSPIDGRRGQIERGVRAVDVSPANDWSQVRVWYAPLQNLGTTAWPVAGFIYNERAPGQELGGERILVRTRVPLPAPAISAEPSKAFAQAFAGLGEPAVQRVGPKPVPRRIAAAPPALPRDPIAAALARYGS